MTKQAWMIVGTALTVVGVAIFIKSQMDKKKTTVMQGTKGGVVGKINSSMVGMGNDTLPDGKVIYSADGSKDCGCDDLKKSFNTNWSDALGVPSKHM